MGGRCRAGIHTDTPKAHPFFFTLGHGHKVKGKELRALMLRLEWMTVVLLRRKGFTLRGVLDGVLCQNFRACRDHSSVAGHVRLLLCRRRAEVKAVRKLDKHLQGPCSGDGTMDRLYSKVMKTFYSHRTTSRNSGHSADSERCLLLI